MYFFYLEKRFWCIIILFQEYRCSNKIAKKIEHNVKKIDLLKLLNFLFSKLLVLGLEGKKKWIIGLLMERSHNHKKKINDKFN